MNYKSALIKPGTTIPSSPGHFDSLAMQVFRYQYAENELYRNFCNALYRNPGNVHSITSIPFLPISFYKSHTVKTGTWNEAQLVFESSATTGTITSKHHIQDSAVYEQTLLHGFEQFYGPVADYTIMALLPSYLERQNASLVYMAKVLMEKSGNPHNGFYINEWDELFVQLQQALTAGEKVLLIGVTFALLDFAASYPADLHKLVVMETGGMKGRREEWTRAQVHDFLKHQWKLPAVHSEYGMTELLSQGYSTHDGVYQCTDTMRIMIRDLNDPLDVTASGSGCINVIDLANIDTCSFIATEDIGRVFEDGTFEVLGRMDHSALRGCSLLSAESGERRAGL